MRTLQEYIVREGFQSEDISAPERVHAQQNSPEATANVTQWHPRLRIRTTAKTFDRINDGIDDGLQDLRG